jgi:hypothetical protein
MRDIFTVEIHQTFQDLIHDVLSLSFDKPTLPLSLTRDVCEEIAACAELKEYIPKTMQSQQRILSMIEQQTHFVRLAQRRIPH